MLTLNIIELKHFILKLMGKTISVGCSRETKRDNHKNFNGEKYCCVITN